MVSMVTVTIVIKTVSVNYQIKDITRSTVLVLWINIISFQTSIIC